MRSQDNDNSNNTQRVSERGRGRERVIRDNDHRLFCLVGATLFLAINIDGVAVDVAVAVAVIMMRLSKTSIR